MRLDPSRKRKRWHNSAPKKGAVPFFWRPLLFLVLLLWLVQPTPQTMAPMTHATPQAAVTILDYQFRPVRLNITTGTTVTWTYIANGSDIHTVTSKNNTQSGSPVFASTNPNPLHPGQSYSFTFNLPGNYAYFCGVHPGLMNAWVNATGPPVTPPPPTLPPSSPTLFIIAGMGLAVLIIAMSILLVRRRKHVKSSNIPLQQQIRPEK